MGTISVRPTATIRENCAATGTPRVATESSLESAGEDSSIASYSSLNSDETAVARIDPYETTDKNS